MTITFAFNMYPVASTYPILLNKTMKILVEQMVVLFYNCHLTKPVELKYLKLFYRYCFLNIQIPYDTQVKQVLANGKVVKRWYGLILPEGFGCRFRRNEKKLVTFTNHTAGKKKYSSCRSVLETIF
jgi:hypothetical protein